MTPPPLEWIVGSFADVRAAVKALNISLRLLSNLSAAAANVRLADQVRLRVMVFVTQSKDEARRWPALSFVAGSLPQCIAVAAFIISRLGRRCRFCVSVLPASRSGRLRLF